MDPKAQKNMEGQVTYDNHSKGAKIVNAVLSGNIPNWFDIYKSKASYGSAVCSGLDT